MESFRATTKTHAAAMDWDYVQTVGALGVSILLILVVSDRWEFRNWQGLKKRTSVSMIIAEWAVFMGFFLFASFILQKIWDLICVCK